MPLPSAAPEPAPESLCVAAADGHAAQLLLLRGEPGRKLGLLWLPAMGVPARKYRHFAAALAGRGWSVALHEWRGQDSSNWRAARACDWGYAQLLADVAASREQLAEAAADTQWIVAGHSLGGQLAALALAQRPQDFAGYAIVGSGHPWWRTFPGWHQGVLLAAIAGFRLVSAVCGYFPGDKVGFAGREARGVIRDWADSAASGEYRPAALDFAAEARLRKVVTPALALRLCSDWYVPAASLDYLLAKLPLLQLQRGEIADREFSGGRAGHFEWMREPLPVVARIDAWLAGIEATTGS
ncbi:putative alpha/beta hydrolase [Tahibacter aquaticus]|uniref:Putative alpha/beta hydrolase n=1 Tax=Tahibacter aquaticus TaxID=520092 RepID=A0A4R6YMM3_9GAMM|nr:alpha/beta fold hydrolase [Tahibacter aquaticus]TDR38690.1 putative alpha/beta hydrolase [Tahibacter aquaticus]